MDFYRVSLDAGEYKIKVRPEVDCSIYVKTMDENGVDSGGTQSPNRGAGFASTVNSRSSGSYTLKFSSSRKVGGLRLYAGAL